MDLKGNLEDEVLQTVSAFKSFLEVPVNNYEETLEFLKKIPSFINRLVEAVEKSIAVSKSPKQYFSLVVYLNQYCTAYELFKDVHTNSSTENEIIYEIKRCICKRLGLLLDNINSVFHDNDTTVGSFLLLMDTALDKISKIDATEGNEMVLSKLNTAYNTTEEILCLSMSIAHVSGNEDNKIITAGCRSVLNSLENLKTEGNQENPNLAMFNLTIDTCVDALCALEAKVNLAVLRLCLNVFSKYRQPINDLYDFCKNSNKSNNNDKDELLTSLISSFDLHMDRIFQIGLFSVASSSIGKRVADIKNVIANLEFLEGELVPAFIAMIKEHLLHRITFAEALKKSWCTQVKLLKKAVHGIIEPSAYCKLIYEELKQKTEEMWTHLKTGKSIQKTMVEPFLTYTEELGQMMSINVDSFESNVQSDIRKQLQVVHNVMKEVAAARDLLLNEKENLSEASNQKIFKRCQILVTSIKRLWYFTINENQPENEILSDTKDKDTQEKSITEDHNSQFESIIAKSKQIVRDRSICTFSQTVILNNKTLKEAAFKMPFNKKLNSLLKTQRDCSYRHFEKLDEYTQDDISKYIYLGKLFNNSTPLLKDIKV